MSFLIKRRDGFTNKLLTQVHRSEAGRFNATALAEGPFGMHHDSIPFCEREIYHVLTYGGHRGASLACILWYGTAHRRGNRDNSPTFVPA